MRGQTTKEDAVGACADGVERFPSQGDRMIASQNLRRTGRDQPTKPTTNNHQPPMGRGGAGWVGGPGGAGGAAWGGRERARTAWQARGELAGRGR